MNRGFSLLLLAIFATLPTSANADIFKNTPFDSRTWNPRDWVRSLPRSYSKVPEVYSRSYGIDRNGKITYGTRYVGRAKLEHDSSGRGWWVASSKQIPGGARGRTARALGYDRASKSHTDIRLRNSLGRMVVFKVAIRTPDGQWREANETRRAATGEIVSWSVPASVPFQTISIRAIDPFTGAELGNWATERTGYGIKPNPNGGYREIRGVDVTPTLQNGMTI